MAEHAHAEALPGHGGHGDGHAHGPSHYVRIWAILLVLLVISVVGPMAEIPVLTLITAFGVACVKAVLVMKYFMHIDQELKLVWYILAGSVVLMVLYFFGVAADVMNHEGTRWTNVAAQAEVQRGMEAGASGAHHGDHGDDGHGKGDHADDGHGKPGGH